MKHTKNQFEIEDSFMNESTEPKLNLKISGTSQLNSLVTCLEKLPSHLFYVFSVSLSNDIPDLISVKILSRSGPVFYYHLGKIAAYNGVTFTSSDPF